jgi:hypothetical protein
MEGDLRLSVLEENERVASEEAKAALVARDEAQERLGRANEAYQAWRVLVKQERERLGMQAPPAQLRAGESIAELVDRQHQNRTEYIRELLKIAGSRGATPAQLLETSQSNNPKVVVPNYPYAQLAKLKGSGEVMQNAFGKYVLTTFYESGQANLE